MEKSYLNNWQKYGAITSIVWMLSAGIFQYRANAKFIGQTSLSVYESCVATANKKNIFDSVNCEQQSNQMYTGLSPLASRGILEVALFPIFFFWIEGFILFRIFRAIEKD